MEQVKKGKKRRGFTKEDGKAYLMLLPYIILFSTFILVPVVIAIGLSFTYFDVINKPSFTGLLNYITLFTQDEVFLKYVLPNTFLYALIVGPGGYVISFLLAWMLAQIQPLPRTILALCIYTPSMLGGVFIGVIWKTIFSGDQSGWFNSILLRLGLIDTPIQFLLTSDYFMLIMIIVSLWSAMGIGFLSMISGILNIDQELYEAAYVDGAKELQIYLKVIIPLIKPAIATAAILVFQQVWTNMEASNYYVNDEGMKSLAFYMNTLSSGTGNTVAGQGVAAAASLIMFVPNLILFCILQKNVMNTMAHSGIK